MTGPPYPRYAPGATPGQNAIGIFQIGVSPIGDIPPFDYWTTVISQYANSPILIAMIDSFNAAMDQTLNIDNFYDMVWNIQTAEGYGLDVWGRIVNVSRTLAFPSAAASYLGFEEAGMSWTGFGQGSFFSGSSATTTNFNLLDVDYRRLILAKAAGNISDGSIPSINAILLGLFPLRGACHVVDHLNMTADYYFPFPLSAVELAILLQSNVLPNPQGVVINIVHA
jgi:Protein of unknown function (DUF2612)